MIERSARAPVPRSIALSTTIFNAFSSNSSSTPSSAKSFWYCLTNALRGRDKISSNAASSSGSRVAVTGSRPTNSGINPYFSKIVRLNLRQKPLPRFALLAVNVGAESDRILADSAFDDFFQSLECSAANKKNIFCIDVDQALLRMLPSAFGRNSGDCSFQNFQERLLNAFTRNIARNGCTVAFTGNLIDLIDINDSAFRFFDIVIRVLQQVHQNGFYIVADISRFRQRCCIGDGKRNIENAVQAFVPEASFPSRSDR